MRAVVLGDEQACDLSLHGRRHEHRPRLGRGLDSGGDIGRLVARPPAGPGWLHEGKFDRYRIIARKQGERVTHASPSGRLVSQKAAQRAVIRIADT